MPRVPKPVTQDTVDIIYGSLGKLEVQLDADPLAFGPKRLNGKIALCRKMLSETEGIFLQVSQDLGWYRSEHRKLEAAYSLTEADMMANDPMTRAGHSIADRKALVKDQLSTECQKIDDLDQQAKMFEAVMVVVKAKRADLKDVQGRLRDQIKLCQEEIGLGSHWGSKPGEPSGFELEPGQGRAAASDGEEIDDIVGGIEGEIHLSREKGEWQDPPEFDPDEGSGKDEEGGEEDEGNDDEEEEESQDEDSEESEESEASEPVVEEVVEPEVTPEPEPEPELTSCPKVGYCSECGEPQYKTSSGLVCENGHGGAPTLDEPPAPEPEPEPEVSPEPDPEPEEGTVESAPSEDAEDEDEEEEEQEETPLEVPEIDDILQPTATEEDVDSFLDGFNPEDSEAKPDPKKKALEPDEIIDIDDLLS